jgi:NADH-quinone oxidoreductase subunit G
MSNAAPMGPSCHAGNRSAYVGTARIEDIDSAKMILLVGTNPRVEAAVLNARIRKAWSLGAKVALVGEAVDLTYDYDHLGTDRETLVKLAAADHSAAVGALLSSSWGRVRSTRRMARRCCRRR